MVISILSYCDTDYKKKQLNDLIKSLKLKFPDDQILIYSHYQNVEPEIYNLVDYYIFDKSNPMSPKIFTDWIFVEPQGKRFHRSSNDWGFAVMQMIKRTVSFLKSLDIKETLFLNYDCNTDDIFKLDLNSKKSKLKDYQVGIFSGWGFNSGLSMTQFYIRLDKINQTFLDLIDFNYYCSFDTSIIPESIWQHILTQSFGENILIDDFGINLQHSLVQRCLPDDSYLQVFFNTILPTRDFNTNKKCLAIWNSKIVLDSVVLEVNDELLVYQNELPHQVRNHSFFCHLNIENVTSIKLISINDINLDEIYKINLDEQYWQNNYHTI